MKLFNSFCYKFYNLVLAENKKLIIGGYDLCGAYCNWLINYITQTHADMIVDESLCVYGVKIYRELALSEINKDEYIGLVPHDKKYAEMFERNGIKYISLTDAFKCARFGFYDWLECTFGADLVKTIPKEDFDYDFKFATNSGVSRQIGLADVIASLETDVEVQRHMKALDVGCGKGGAIMMMKQSFLFDRVDGIELSPKICKIAEDNMKKLNIESNIMNVSATEFDKYGNYDLLYLYDPFRGEVFLEALRQIEYAVRNRSKPIFLVYANPYHHKDIVEGGVFKLVNKVDTDFFHRDVHIYTSEAK